MSVFDQHIDVCSPIPKYRIVFKTVWISSEDRYERYDDIALCTLNTEYSNNNNCFDLIRWYRRNKYIYLNLKHGAHHTTHFKLYLYYAYIYNTWFFVPLAYILSCSMSIPYWISCSVCYIFWMDTNSSICIRSYRSIYLWFITFYAYARLYYI